MTFTQGPSNTRSMLLPAGWIPIGMVTQAMGSMDGALTWREMCRVRFWRDWHELVRRINPRAYTVAEIWDDASQLLADGGFSATMNYTAFAFPVKGFLVDGVLPRTQAAKELDARREKYPVPTQYGLLNLMIPMIRPALRR